MIDGKRASDRAIEVVLSYYAAFNRGDWEGMLALLSEAVVHDPNQGRRELGREAFRTFLARMQRSYAEKLQDIVVTATPDGRHAAAEYRVQGEYLADDDGLPPAHGQRYELPGGAFFALHEQRIVRVTNYYNLQDWLRQIERREP
jgi:steroid delta-isomerase-like uncharacterized protein